MEEDFQTMSDSLSHSLSTVVWRSWVINLSILPLDKGCIIWSNEKHQSLIDWLICLVTACWGPHEDQGLEHIGGRARLTTTKKQKKYQKQTTTKIKKKTMHDKDSVWCLPISLRYLIEVCVHKEEVNSAETSEAEWNISNFVETSWRDVNFATQEGPW